MTIFHAIPSIPYEHQTGEAGPELQPLFANRASMAMSRPSKPWLIASGWSR